MRRVLVCGGRDYANFQRVYDVLTAEYTRETIDVVIHGNARGADALAGSWAKLYGVKVVSVPADWEKDGRAAGPIRNQRMLDLHHPTEVIAFPGGKGTKDMMQRARKAGLPVKRIRDD